MPRGKSLTVDQFVKQAGKFLRAKSADARELIVDMVKRESQEPQTHEVQGAYKVRGKAKLTKNGRRKVATATTGNTPGLKRGGRGTKPVKKGGKRKTKAQRAADQIEPEPTADGYDGYTQSADETGQG